MSVSLYRKYRPVSFEEVTGQSHITRTLTNAIIKNRVSHAYLFTGPRGTGKTSTAKILAMALNCEAGHGQATPYPDGACPNCQAIRRGTSLDVLEIDAASNRGIDDIRDIRERVHFAPVEGRMKVYIVDEVHMLTTEAFNALLKTLEEPPAHAVFVLATTEPHRVPATILSRCQRFDFRRPSVEEIVQVLKLVADREGIDAPEGTLVVIAQSAAGSFRDAIGVLDQLSAYSEGSISVQDALTMLGMADQELLFEIVDVVHGRDAQAALLFVERLVQTGADLNQFLKDLLGHLRNLYVIQHTLEPPPGLGTSKEHIDGLRSQANLFLPVDIVAFIDLIGEAQRAVRQGADPRLEFELLLIKLTRPETDPSVRGLVARLEQLERQWGNGPISTPMATRRSSAPGPSASSLDPEAARKGDEGPAAAAAPHAGADQPTTEEATPAHESVPPTAAPPPTREAAPREAVAGATDLNREDAPKAPREDAREQGRIEATADNLRRAWPIVLNAVKRRRPGLFAVLSEARVEELQNGTLLLVFPDGMAFQAAQTTREDNSAALSEILGQMTGKEIRIATRVSGESPDEADHETVDARILTGDELIQLLKQEFDARPIDDETSA